MKSKTFYQDYQQYLDFQKEKAQRTRFLTNRPKGEQKRQEIYELINLYAPDIASLLCVGCRDEAEINFFKNKNIATEGIDLYSGNCIIQCDMSQMHNHPYFQNKQYDALLFLDSLEHCMDLDGLLQGIKNVCKKYIIACVPFRSRPSSWDCAVHPFMLKDTYLEGLQTCFTDFKILYTAIRSPKKNEKVNTHLLFILKKNNIMIFI